MNLMGLWGIVGIILAVQVVGYLMIYPLLKVASDTDDYNEIHE